MSPPAEVIDAHEAKRWPIEKAQAEEVLGRWPNSPARRDGGTALRWAIAGVSSAHYTDASPIGGQAIDESFCGFCGKVRDLCNGAH
jgi:hypothetical protein